MWNYLSNLSVRVLKSYQAPLPLKEAAWGLIAWVAKAGRANPISWLIRPWAAHKSLKRTVGLVMAVLVVTVAIWGPFPTLASDTGGPLELAVMSEGEIELNTQEAIQMPVENFRVSQGYRWLHPGVDLAAKTGEAVKAVANGKVILVKKDRFAYGQHVIINHGEYETLYAHLSKITVEEGQEVTTDTVIGEVGSTGRSTGPHLHLEIRESGRPVNPKMLLGLK